jgi:elongation factor Ts
MRRHLMSNISAKLVKELRDRTSAGMMDCKKALVETNGDIDAAVEHLKKKGLAKAGKKSDRLATEGRVALEVSDDFSKATLTEVNCETDFVSKNENFEELASSAVKQVHSTSVSDIEELNSTTIDGVVFEDYLKEKISKIGENIVVRRFVSLSTSEGGFVNGYLHANGRVGVVIAIKGEATEANKSLAKDVCMHIAAMNPKYLSTSEIPEDVIKSEVEGMIKEIEKENEENRRLKKPEKNIPKYVSKAQLTDEVMAQVTEDIKAELKAEGKPEKIWDRILPGKVERFISDNTLLDQKLSLLSQEFVKAENKESVETVLANNGLEAIEFVRFELGEGLEKKSDDFASEVAEQLK